MALLSSIKSFFYNTKLNRDAAVLSNYKREVISISSAKSIGILYNASKAENIVSITKFSEYLKENGKQVDSLGFINNKNKELVNSSYFNKLSLNWYGVPTAENISLFQKKKHDLLIYANIDTSLPLDYLAATSIAKFRIGPFNNEKTAIFDFMINIEKQQKLDYFFEQIKHFLTNINA